MYLAPEEIPLARLTYSLFHSLPLLLPIASLSFMSSRFADPTTMRTRSPIYHDENLKRPPPSPSSKPPPPKKSEPCKAQAVIAPSPEPHVESCTDKVCRPVLQIPGSSPHPTLRQVSTARRANHHFLSPKVVRQSYRR
jgi:hypothetical protein